METITIDDNEFAIFRQGRSTYRVLNTQANLDRFAKRLAQANKPMKTYAQQFEADRKAQFKMTATPCERARAELYRDTSEFAIWTDEDQAVQDKLNQVEQALIEESEFNQLYQVPTFSELRVA
jgi:hypothetical protein